MFKRLFGGKSATGDAPAPASPMDCTVALPSVGGDRELDFLLIRPSDADIVRALDGWRWIGLTGLAAIAVSAFGEVFFQAPDGSILHLDTIEGGLRPVAADLSDFTAQLDDPQRRDELLLGGLVIGARNQGLSLAPGECYDFKVPPVLGGPIDVGQMQKLPFVVKLDIAGQLHEQLRDMPPGTQVTGFKIAD